MKIDQQRRCKSVKKSVATYEKTTSHILYFFYMTTSLFITHNIIKLFVMSPKENLHHHSNITHWTKSLVKIVPMNSNHTEKLIPNIPLMKKNARTFISQKINKSFWIFECIKFVHFFGPMWRILRDKNGTSYCCTSNYVTLLRLSSSFLDNGK